MALILASASPRRRELLSLITKDFTVETSRVDEAAITAPTPAKLAQALADAKCRAVAARHPEDIVIGCDTVVDYAGRVFGKPKDHEDALRMLRALSGAQHHVHTGVCIAFPGGEERFTVTTKVKFYPIEEAQLEAYAATGEPYDKAGAYAIQGGAAAFCEGLEGCYYNVMGFPVSRVARALAKIVEKFEESEKNGL